MVLPMKGIALCKDHLQPKAWYRCSDPLEGEFLLPIPRLLGGMPASLPSVQRIGAWVTVLFLLYRSDF